MNIPAYILALSQQLHTQDNRCTSHPIFQVRDVKQVPCLPEHADDTHWWDEEGSAVLDEELIKTLEDASLGAAIALWKMMRTRRLTPTTVPTPRPCARSSPPS